MKFNKVLLSLSVMAALAAPSAFAGVGLNILGGGSMGMTKYTPALSGATSGSKIAFPTAGVSLDFGNQVGAEIGAFYFTGASKLTVGALETTMKTKGFEIPLMLRVNMGSHFALGAGGYYAINDKTCTQVGTGAETCSTPGVKSNYGVVGSLKGKIPVGATASLVLDARYVMGLKNQSSTVGQEVKTSAFEFLAGVRFGLNK